MSASETPNNGWTGGQVSMVRVLLGAALVWRFVRWETPWGLLAVVPVLALAVGFRTRISGALSLIALAMDQTVDSPDALDAGSSATVILVFLLLPGAPYGSRDARERVDPGGGWSFPAWLHLFVRLAAVAALVLAVWTHGFGPGVLLLVVLALDPGWIAPRRPGERSTVYYDGSCALCHGAVRGMLAEDVAGDAFRFAPLFGAAFQESLDEEQRADLPDSLILQRSNGEIELRSGAVLGALGALGGFWRPIGATLRLVPAALRDWLYDRVASVRLRIFGKREAACPLLPAELQERFDLRT